MACNTFPKEGLVPDVTTHVVGGVADGYSVLDAGDGNTVIFEEVVKSPQMFGAVAGL